MSIIPNTTLNTTKIKKLNRAALISVYDKTGVLELAQSLFAMGYTVLASGGTYKKIYQSLNASKEHDTTLLVSVEDYTKNPEILGGRVKTLHPKIHGGILAQRNMPNDTQDLKNQKILPIDLVAVNLYPFEETITHYKTEIAQAIEQIDIGGVTLLRAAAKNYAHVIALVNPQDYQSGVVLLQAQMQASVQDNPQLFTQRLQFASKVFSHTAHYEATIAQYMVQYNGKISQLNDKKCISQTKKQAIQNTQIAPSPYLTLPYKIKEELRYGENPHQAASLYQQSYPLAGINSITNANQLHGKDLSFNNIRDVEAAISVSKHFELSNPENLAIAVGVKHGNPCGVAVRKTIVEAWNACFQADSLSIFGGIVALSQTVDLPTAILLSKVFLEIVIAPRFTKEAINILTKKKNIRLLVLPFKEEKKKALQHTYAEQQYFSISGGLLSQDLDKYCVTKSDLVCVTKKRPTKLQIEELLFAWNVCKFVKSNAIVLTKNRTTIGIGAGQMNRVGAAVIALEQARNKKKAKGSVLASDAFFPMSDTVALAATFGISAIIQPGGSIKDQQSVDECNINGIAMLFTAKRHFLH